MSNIYCRCLFYRSQCLPPFIYFSCSNETILCHYHLDMLHSSDNIEPDTMQERKGPKEFSSSY
jgi:hypothetical protein